MERYDGEFGKTIPGIFTDEPNHGAILGRNNNTGEDFANASVPMMGQPLARNRTLAFPDVRIRGFVNCPGIPLELNPETAAIAPADAVRRTGSRVANSFPAVSCRRRRSSSARCDERDTRLTGRRVVSNATTARYGLWRRAP